ncbi:MAG: efflux RND transporter periplasmic adaptor subunit [Acidobacteriota bacterium]
MGVRIAIALAVMPGGCSKSGGDAQRRVEHEARKETATAKGGDASASESAPHDDEAEEHQELPTKVRLPSSVVRGAGIKTSPAILDSLPATVDLTGEIAADPDRSAQLAARVAGRILDVRVKDGDRVKAGQAIAVLDSPELARARATLAAAVARERSARLNAERLRSLEAKALASGQEVAAANAEATALVADVAAARQTLAALGQAAEQAEGHGARVSIRTPLAGFVLSRDAVRGQSVTAEHIIAVIGDLDQVYFLGRLFEKDLAKVKTGAATDVRLNAYPTEIFEGTIETIGRQIDPAARTVTARILVRNHGDLVKVGLFGTARVVIGSAEAQAKRVVVRNAAVTRVANKDVVFVRQPDGDFELHPVTLGRAAAGQIEILSGLRAGEAVVVDGVFSLKSGILKQTFGEGD